jgi:electron transfer flavoprotein alpha/beta subunit
MPAFNVEFDVICTVCGCRLSAETETNEGRKLVIAVYPCVVCMNSAVAEGRAAGYDEGVHATGTD